MISNRSIYSLAQFLEVQEIAVSAVLLGKYGVRASLHSNQLLFSLLNELRGIDERTLMQILAEIVATKGDLRARINPKYRFDDRLEDLEKCLLLDGYMIEGKKLLQADPSIADAEPLEDDLIAALQDLGSPRSQDIIARINASTEAFRAPPPDYNASLVNARVALETLAGDVAEAVVARNRLLRSYNPAKWGEVISFLRTSGEITVEEEKGLAGVFGFLSPGAHRQLGYRKTR